jgi:hypothetical protein
MRLVTDDERRARLAVRHALAPAFRADSPEAVTRAMTVLHATEPSTVHLACRARFDDCTVADLDRALYADRTLVKQLAMRRTLFVFPRDLLPAVWPSASARVAAAEQARMTRDAVQAGLPADWLARARAEILDLLAENPDGLPAGEIRKAVPILDVRIQTSAGEQWSAYRVLTHLGLTADVVRGVNLGRWPTSRPRWTLMTNWLGDVPPALDGAAGYRELIRRWLTSFGPGTEDDIVWWLGATKSVVRAALASLDAVPVTLSGGETGWLLPDDLGETPDPGPWVALLPVLDPTVMGWKSRDFYLGPHRQHLFDRTGNAGTTAWVDGRIVGSWTQDPAGVVRVHLLEVVAARAARALREEAERLTAWLAGTRLPTGWASPAMRRAGQDDRAG